LIGRQNGARRGQLRGYHGERSEIPDASIADYKVVLMAGLSF
jgi:hypothetical protein